jgi:hypothetical protein
LYQFEKYEKNVGKNCNPSELLFGMREKYISKVPGIAAVAWVGGYRAFDLGVQLPASHHLICPHGMFFGSSNRKQISKWQASRQFDINY